MDNTCCWDELRFDASSGTADIAISTGTRVLRTPGVLFGNEAATLSLRRWKSACLVVEIPKIHAVLPTVVVLCIQLQQGRMREVHELKVSI